MQSKVDKKPHAEAVITGTLAVAEIDAHFKKALDRVVREVELPGFRKGKAPVERVLQELGPKSIWREAAEDALRDGLGDVLKEHSLIPILPPSISLEVSAEQTDVPFTVHITTPPKAEIKDYKKIGEAALKKLEKLDEPKEKGEARKSLMMQVLTMVGKVPEKDGDVSSVALAEEDAKKLGFENVKALEHFLDMESDRAVENYDGQRKRGAVADALVKEATIDFPLVMLEDETRAMLESTKKNIAGQGMPFNEYLAKRGMSEEEVLAELRPQAEKRVALDLVFAKIAGEEKLTPDNDETHRVAHALMHQGVPDDRAHQYAAEVSIREKIWSLFGLAAPKPAVAAAEEKPAHSHEGHPVPSEVEGDHSDPNHTH